MSEKESPTERLQLARSKNGKDVWYDPVSSHAATHISDTPNLDLLAKEVIEQIDLDEPYLLFHTDMGRIIGTSDLVETDDGDEIIYAKRLNRDNYTAFNLTKGPQPSSLVTTALELQDDSTYELVSTWIGPSDSPSFPGGERETPDSKEFWSRHALAWGAQEIQPSTETSVCPW